MIEAQVLSIKQPWAWLIINKYKDIENRYWSTDYRGAFLIHAPNKIDNSAYLKYPSLPIPRPHKLLTGGIIGKAKIIDCVTSSKSNWFRGPYGFVLRQAKPIKFIKTRGYLNFFTIQIPKKHYYPPHRKLII